MTPDELRAVLRDTLDDRRLSRTERRALGQLLDDAATDPASLSAFRAAAFELAREAVNDAAARPVLEWLDDVVAVVLARVERWSPPAAECHFSPGDDCPRRIAGLLGETRRRAEICVFTITDDRITSAILDARRRGVAVRIVSDDEKAFDAGSDVERLAAAGVPVRLDRTPYHMHHKFALFDGERLLTGSYNWTRSAAESNEENFIVTGDPRLIAPFADLFERLWAQLTPVAARGDLP